MSVSVDVTGSNGWLDEPNETGWWWCMQDESSLQRSGVLYVFEVHIYSEAEQDQIDHDLNGYPQGHIRITSGDHVGWSGNYSG